jgi:hypothetical protein
MSYTINLFVLFLFFNSFNLFAQNNNLFAKRNRESEAYKIGEKVLIKFDTEGKMLGEHRVWRGPGHFRFCSANSYHRIELKEGVTPWTLFMPGPQTREWGFLVKDKWIHNDLYLEDHKQHS